MGALGQVQAQLELGHQARHLRANPGPRATIPNLLRPRAPPIVLAIRGLNLAKESDYKTLLDNQLGKQMFDDGYVHHGLLKLAVWLLNDGFWGFYFFNLDCRWLLGLDLVGFVLNCWINARICGLIVAGLCLYLVVVNGG